MFLTAFTLVIASGLIHSVWNLFTKKSVNKVVFLWFCQWTAILIFLPFSLIEIGDIPAIEWMGWLLLFASMALHGIYVLLLAQTYSIGDLSQAYPIMRGISPLLVPIVGVVWLGESLMPIGWLGVSCIVAGIVLVGNLQAQGFSNMFNRTIVLATLVGVMISSYTVVDKLTLAYLPAVTLNEASNIGNLLALSWIALRSGDIRQEWRINWRTIILGGILAPGGYILFLKALEIMPVSQIAPMREIGTVFGTLLGIFVLHETQGRNRFVGSVCITAGIILLAK